MKSEYSQLKEYMSQSNKTVAVTGSGISYLYGMSRLKQSVGRLNAGRIFSASYVRKNPEEFYAESHAYKIALARNGVAYVLHQRSMQDQKRIRG
ncbi:MAG: hypothetical protein LUD12_15525 [Lachnospiraceae bacterium]|nr:hypothetical protein [Lachnospiraceae bacterium]